MMSVQLYIVSAPSGAGKTTLVHLLAEQDPKVRLSVSTTTRQPRSGEKEGQAYFFVSEKAFQCAIKAGHFLEWAKVHGNYYGTSREVVEAVLAAGFDEILEIDWQGARQVKAAYPQAKSIFILPPSLETLKSRLCHRATDTAEVIARRIAAAKEEMAHAHEFDYIIVNDVLPQALEELQSIMSAMRLRFDVQYARYASLFEKLTLNF